jgi:hypothetical protein
MNMVFFLDFLFVLFNSEPLVGELELFSKKQCSKQIPEAGFKGIPGEGEFTQQS